MSLIDLAETGYMPDALIRWGIRRLLAKRRKSEAFKQSEHEQAMHTFVEDLRTSPLAVDTDAANQQHYEVPAEFYQQVLGPRLKYSACLHEPPQTTLAEAEVAMLRLTCQRAEIADGMQILELGCGWGSLTLWLAEQYPNCDITAVSNSASQRKFIQSQARERGFANVRIITADMRKFHTTEKFDRIVSIEMFEHMRNYELLLHHLATWLKPQGKAFVHIFCHKDMPYLFETEGASNWMGKHFFTGGMMPSEDLLGKFSNDLAIENQWRVSGMHYWRTCEAWLTNLDANRAAVDACFRTAYSKREAARCVQRWRMFFMACAELFRYEQGEEWFVAHYLFQASEVSQQRAPLLSSQTSP